jgi:hypothetical protein
MDRKSIRNLFQNLSTGPVRILESPSQLAQLLVSLSIQRTILSFYLPLQALKLDLLKTLTLLIQSILLTLNSLIWLPMSVPVLLPLYTKTETAVLEHYAFYVPT